MTIITTDTGNLFFVKLHLGGAKQTGRNDVIAFEETSSDLLGEDGSLVQSIQMSKEFFKSNSPEYFENVDDFMATL
ncbi:hypothetical protein KJ652_06300 [Patescibacteria group bacterium]|nr:hypothetical protein [Patescibacteria group bacterium]MBU1124163.1 hypothetical protein [Patescibacteria group bacterium]MBU1911849.1 hypothetical protein [Patescibacteria group bacterium]